MKIIDFEAIRLKHGAHIPGDEFCVMELAAYLADEPWSDHPECVSPAIAAMLRVWNDFLNDDDRQELKPYSTKVLHTAGNVMLESARGWMASDWLVRSCAPIWLRLAGFAEHANILENLPAIISVDEADAAQRVVDLAADDAKSAVSWATAGNVSYDPAYDEAWDSAWIAIGAAAVGAARAATETCAHIKKVTMARDRTTTAAWIISLNAARVAAVAASRNAPEGLSTAVVDSTFAPIVKSLQASAFTLLDGMIAGGRRNNRFLSLQQRGDFGRLKIGGTEWTMRS